MDVTYAQLAVLLGGVGVVATVIGIAIWIPKARFALVIIGVVACGGVVIYGSAKSRHERLQTTSAAASLEKQDKDRAIRAKLAPEWRAFHDELRRVFNHPLIEVELIKNFVAQDNLPTIDAHHVQLIISGIHGDVRRNWLAETFGPHITIPTEE